MTPPLKVEEEGAGGAAKDSKAEPMEVEGVDGADEGWAKLAQSVEDLD